jgi:DNA gyrase/topoisomerase IV subunit B
VTVKRYSAADIQLVEFDEAVRSRPAMYFGVDRRDPDLATQVLCSVLAHGLHPAARVAAAHTLQVKAEITGDLAFMVSDDRADALGGPGAVRLGYYGSLLGADRWAAAAAAAVSSRTVVEVWRDGLGLRQELAGLRPVTEPQDIDPPPGSGTRVSFELDRAYFGHGQAIAADLTSLDLHGPHCNDPAGPGQVTLIDLRHKGNPTANYR